MIEANKDIDYLDLAKENSILTNEMQFAKVEGTVSMGMVGNYEVYYIIKDENNNEIRSEKVIVKVVDNIAPTIEYVGTIPMVDGKIKLSLVEGVGVYTQPEFEVADNTVAGAKVVGPIAIGSPLDIRTPGIYTMEYYATDNYGNESGRIQVEVEVKEYIPAPRITARKKGYKGLKKDIVEGNTYAYELEVYSSKATKITIIKEDLTDSTNVTTTTYDELNGMILGSGKYTIIAEGSSEAETTTVTFIVDAGI